MKLNLCSLFLLAAIFCAQYAQAQITGPSSVCTGSSITLSDATTGGTWTSSNTAVATVGSVTGLVTGVAAGTARISYTVSGSPDTAIVTVNPVPVISGLSVVTAGSNITLTASESGGVWSSSNPSVAIAGTNGIVTGVANGTAIVSYEVDGGCGMAYATEVVTVICGGADAIINTIAGDGGAGYGGDGGPASAATFNAPNGIAVDGSGNVYIADFGEQRVRKINTSGIIVTIAGNGTAGFSGDGGAATAAELYTPNGLALDATGNLYIADLNNNRVRMVNTAGVISTFAGNALIGYRGDGGAATAASLYAPSAVAVDGVGNVYIADYMNQRIRKVNNYGIISTVGGNGAAGYSGDGGAATLAKLNFPLGVNVDGSGNVLIADFSNNVVRKINLAGIITTIAGNGSAGNTGDGGAATAAELNGPMGVAADESGNIFICDFYNIEIREVNNSGIISDFAGNGTEGFSGDGGPATAAEISPPSLIAIDGSGNIYYADGGNGHIRKISYGSLVASIAGTLTLCVSGTTSLSDVSSGGTWSSSNTGVATIGSTGIVSGVSPGSTIISYTTACGAVSAVVTVNSTAYAGTITGSSSVCTGSAITLIDAAGGGTWNSSNPSLATVSGGVVAGVTAGSVIISYTVSSSCGTAVATKSVSIYPSPNPGSITGASSVAIAATTTLSDATSGGLWHSGNSSVATVGSTGIVTGVAAGAAVISYTVTNSCGPASATKTINVISSVASISGVSAICAGTTTSFSDATSGGVWTSSNTSAATIGSGTGIVTGVAAGVAVITYNVSGNTVTKSVTVNSSPFAISGTSGICTGNTTTFTDATSGGAWSTSNSGVAAVNTSGIVTGVAAGTVVISYSAASGCASTKGVTINAAPATISGTGSLCSGSSYTFTDGTSGGLWSSSNTSSASVGVTGVVTGVAGASVATISYSISGCASTYGVTVNATPYAVGGASSICAVASTTFTDASTGGSWSISNPSVANISTSGVVSGVAPGTVMISYTISGCSSSRSLTVSPAPTAITGTPSMCAGTSVTFTNGVSGGIWSSSNTSVANVGIGTGVVTGVAGGTAIIVYNYSGCTSGYTVTINPSPAAIAGMATLCAGTATTYTDGTTGGAWSSSIPSVATVGTGTGVVVALSSGTSAISYTTSNGCSSTNIITVSGTLAAISGPAAQCTGQSTQFTDPTTGGTWTSSNTSAATVGAATGIVTGVAAAPATISYSAGGCTATMTITVYATPYAISGPSVICTGATGAYSDVTTGGVWTVVNTSLGTFAGSTLTGVSAGTTIISYAAANGCASTKALTVNTTPASISGPASLCTGLTYNFTDGTTGGVWSSSNISGATVNASSGVVTGVAYSAEFISYTVSGCYSTKAITVYPSPYAISGAGTVSIAAAATFTDASSGGVWTSANTSVATVASTTGSVTGVALGTTIITYTLATGCNATRSITVIPASGRESEGGITPGSSDSNSASGIADVKILPNPNKGEFIISGNLGTATCEVALQITDMLGHIVYGNKLVAENGMINELVQLNNSLASGMYILTIRTGQMNEAFHFVVTK